MAKNPRLLFVNLAVRDLPRSMAFWKALGFDFDQRFCDENAACMVISDQAFAMLLVEKRFKDFTKRELCDTTKATEGLFALSCTSRDEVDALVKKAIENGGSHAMDPMDHGFMYAWSFYDPDGHHWEVMWMDPSAIPPQP